MPEDTDDTVTIRRLTSLTRTERDALWHTLYNLLSQGGWPEGLDIPKDVDGTLAQLDSVRAKLEWMQESDRERPPLGRPRGV